MSKKKVLNRSNLPSRAPVAGTVLVILALDYWSAPEWAWGMCILALVIIWVVSIYSMVTEESIDINDFDKTQ